MVREVFSFWTGHPTDFELWVRLGYAMNHGGNPYGVLPPVPSLSFANDFGSRNAATVAYLPFWPIVTGIIFALYSSSGVDNRLLYYFLLKQPVIAGDICLAFLLYLYVSARKPQSSIWALMFWLLSPFTVIISGIWGMFDSIAMTFVMVSIMSAGYAKRGFWTGLGIFAKSVPLIYAVPTTIREKRGALGLLIAVGLPSLASIATFVVMGWPTSAIKASLTSTVVKGGDSMSIWDSLFYLNYLAILQPPTVTTYNLLGLLWIPAVIALTIVAFRTFRSETDYGLVQSLLVVTLAFLIFKARVTEQYAIYLFALATIDVAVWNSNRKRLLLPMVAVALVYLVSNNYFLIRFLSPVYPSSLQIELALSDEIGPIRNLVNFLSGSTFTFLNIGYLIAILRNRTEGRTSAVNQSR